MNSPTASPNLEEYEELAETMCEQAVLRAVASDVPIGVVIGAVIFHLTIQAQHSQIPEDVLHSAVSHACASYRFDEVRRAGVRKGI
ncbi:hypothetical protein [Pseudomonas huanghezhanensis]|uniref:hypothetical protein n=1 Tax=Pseudomonas huanghezhanensis TaxID=3002903 RepID=UPI0022860766|nr:hypothetical protein [Pseudomonas sp. BSw22131]